MDSEFLNTFDDIKTKNPTILLDLDIDKKLDTSSDVKKLETPKHSNSNDTISNKKKEICM